MESFNLFLYRFSIMLCAVFLTGRCSSGLIPTVQVDFRLLVLANEMEMCWSGLAAALDIRAYSLPRCSGFGGPKYWLWLGSWGVPRKRFWGILSERLLAEGECRNCVSNWTGTSTEFIWWIHLAWDSLICPLYPVARFPQFPLRLESQVAYISGVVMPGVLMAVAEEENESWGDVLMNRESSPYWDSSQSRSVGETIGSCGWQLAQELYAISSCTGRSRRNHQKICLSVTAVETSTNISLDSRDFYPSNTERRER